MAVACHKERASVISCTFVGDIMPGSQRISEPWPESIVESFEAADLVIGNLESPIVSERRRDVNLGKIPLWSTVDNLDVLSYFGFTHLNLNNNHTFDLFEEGLRETAQHLREAGIEPFGLDWGGLSQVTIIERYGIKIGLVTANWVETRFTGGLSRDLRNLDISAIRKTVDILVCSIHWGDDHNIFINRDQQETARRLIDDGVDLVIGHHPHVPQGYEVYQGKYIFYSLGNFIFTPKEEYDHLPYAVRFEDQRENVLFQRPECKIGLVVRARLGKGGDYTVEEVRPVYRADTLPSPVPDHRIPFYENLLATMNDQVRRSDYGRNDDERKRILSTYTLPLILARPWYWPMFFKKLGLRKVLWFTKGLLPKQPDTH
jgi:hypothetical protein